MGFNSAHLSDSTIKSFVDRLLKQNKKKTVDQWPPKRHQVQEDVAAMLGYANWHALSSQLSKSTALEEKTKTFEQEKPQLNKNEPIPLCQAIVGRENDRQDFFDDLLKKHNNIVYVTGGLAIPVENKSFTVLSGYECEEVNRQQVDSVQAVMEQWNAQRPEHNMSDLQWKQATDLLLTAATIAERANDMLMLNLLRIRYYVSYKDLYQVAFEDKTYITEEQQRLARSYFIKLPGFNTAKAYQNEPQDNTVIEQQEHLGRQLATFLSTCAYKKKIFDNVHLIVDGKHTLDVFRFFDHLIAVTLKNSKPVVVFDGCWEDQNTCQQFLQRMAKIERTHQLYIGYYLKSDFENDKLFTQISSRIDTDNTHNLRM